MAVDIFLEVEGIKGESKDHKHKDQIDVLSWSWGMSQSGTAHMGGGAGAGKVNVQDLNFTHYIDKASPTLILLPETRMLMSCLACPRWARTIRLRAGSIKPVRCRLAPCLRHHATA